MLFCFSFLKIIDYCYAPYITKNTVQELSSFLLRLWSLWGGGGGVTRFHPFSRPVCWCSDESSFHSLLKIFTKFIWSALKSWQIGFWSIETLLFFAIYLKKKNDSHIIQSFIINKYSWKTFLTHYVRIFTMSSISLTLSLSHPK